MADDDYSRGQQQFSTFVRQSVGWVGGLVTSVPLLSKDFKLISIPEDQSHMTVLLMALSALVFLTVFWHRDRIIGRRAALWSWVCMLLGLVFIDLFENKSSFLDQYNISLYLSGGMLFSLGLSLLFISGFISNVGRTMTLNALAPNLDTDHWNQLLEFASITDGLQKYLRTSSISEESRKALQEAFGDLCGSWLRAISKVSQGNIVVLSPAMERYYDLFWKRVRTSFDAVSDEDMAYWVSPEAKKYLAENVKLVDKKVRVRRVFVLRDNYPLTLEEKDAIRNQIQKGISVAILSSSEYAKIADEQTDFSVFDSFAVAFWMIGAGRAFKLTVDKDECGKFKKKFDEIWDVSTSVHSGEKSANREESSQDFDAWLRLREEG